MAEESGATINLTATDAKILATTMKHATADPQASLKLNVPQVDWAAVAAELGYKDANVARTRYQQVKKKKLGVAAGGPAGGVNKPSPTKKSPTKPKKVEADGEGSVSPTKPKRVRKPKVKTEEVVKEEDVPDGYNGDDAMFGEDTIKEETLDEILQDEIFT